MIVFCRCRCRPLSSLLADGVPGDQGFLNSYHEDFPNAHVFQPNLPQEVLKTRPLPDMEPLSTLYNADVGLYTLANKVKIMLKVATIRYIIELYGHSQAFWMVQAFDQGLDRISRDIRSWFIFVDTENLFVQAEFLFSQIKAEERFFAKMAARSGTQRGATKLLNSVRRLGGGRGGISPIYRTLEMMTVLKERFR
ncbi:hypothetical protein Peur_024915 [Populus x canadensis]